MVQRGSLRPTIEIGPWYTGSPLERASDTIINMQHYIQPASHLSGWQPQATSFSVLRLPYYGPSFETIIRILQSEAVVLKQCALFMKLPRECSYQARRINQSLLVALCMIACIRQNFLLGRGGAEGEVGLCRRMATGSPETAFFSIWFLKKYNIYMMTVYNLDYLDYGFLQEFIMLKHRHSSKMRRRFNLGMV